jgi:hypothetical protein
MATQQPPRARIPFPLDEIAALCRKHGVEEVPGEIKRAVV